jgi:hypothetical protein
MKAYDSQTGSGTPLFPIYTNNDNNYNNQSAF